jgi:hypothetical protein
VFISICAALKRVVPQVVELHDKSGKKLRKGQGVCIIDSDISCDFDEGRAAQVASAAPVAATSRFTLSDSELKEAATFDDDGPKASVPASLFVGAGKRIKGSLDTAASGSGAAEGSMSSTEAEPPAVCWKLQFHWYDGDQDKVAPSIASKTSSAPSSGISRTNSAPSSGITASSASSASSDSLSRTKSAGPAASGATDPFAGAAHSLKPKKSWGT